MKAPRVPAAAVSLLLGAGFLYLVGRYTDNAGFRFAGLILAAVAIISALARAGTRRGGGDGEAG